MINDTRWHSIQAAGLRNGYEDRYPQEIAEDEPPRGLLRRIADWWREWLKK